MDLEKILLILAGGLVGFLSSVLKDYFIEKQKKQNKIIELKREKLEELFLILGRTFDVSLLPLNLREVNKGDGARAGMISRFYFPEILIEYQKYIFEYVSYCSKENPSSKEQQKYTESYKNILKILEKESEKYI